MKEVLVIGAGIGGLTAGAILAKAGVKVTVLEANYLPGGCCSSYWRKGYVFETGATTLMGFEPGQPLYDLEQRLGINFNKQVIEPAMAIHIDGQMIIRHRGRRDWIEASVEAFGQRDAQTVFWNKMFTLSDFVWRVSGVNINFPPSNLRDFIKILVSNRLSDYPHLRYAFISTQRFLVDLGLAQNERFVRFLNAQLMITAQSTVDQTPLLFAAPALCYTNYKNYYVPGGLINLANDLVTFIEKNQGKVIYRENVIYIKNTKNKNYTVFTANGNEYNSVILLCNLPIWNLPPKTEGKMHQYFSKVAGKLTHYMGAFTMGVAIEDVFSEGLSLHNQVILPKGKNILECHSNSVFISLSARGDEVRAPAGQRVLAFSTHAEQPQTWFNLPKAEYEIRKLAAQQSILEAVLKGLPGFDVKHIKYMTASTPFSWADWLYRHEGTVGGIPQSLNRPIYQWQGALTPFEGFYRCGDTVYPGQGVPGVVLGGIAAANRILLKLNS